MPVRCEQCGQITTRWQMTCTECARSEVGRLRDEIARDAMKELMRDLARHPATEVDPARVARSAYRWADAMLVAGGHVEGGQD